MNGNNVAALGNGVRGCALCVLGSVLAVACAPTYQSPSPSAGPTIEARLRLVAPVTGGFWQGSPVVMVAALGNSSCGTGEGSGRLATFSNGPRFGLRPHQDLGMTGGEHIALEDRHELQVPGDREFTLIFRGDSFLGSPAAISCVAAAAFTPAAGRQYEAVFSWWGANCKLDISNIDAQAIRTPEPSTRMLACRWPLRF